MTGRDIKCLAAWSTPNATGELYDGRIITAVCDLMGHIGCNEETLAHAFVWRENIKRLGCWMEFDDAPKVGLCYLEMDTAKFHLGQSRCLDGFGLGRFQDAL